MTSKSLLDQTISKPFMYIDSELRKVKTRFQALKPSIEALAVGSHSFLRSAGHCATAQHHWPPPQGLQIGCFRDARSPAKGMEVTSFSSSSHGMSRCRGPKTCNVHGDGCEELPCLGLQKKRPNNLQNSFS